MSEDRQDQGTAVEERAEGWDPSAEAKAPRDFAQYVRQRRKELRLTQDDAAQKAEVSPSTWRKLESGDMEGFRTSTLVAAAKALELDVPEFFLLAGTEAKSGDSGDRPVGTALFADVFRSWRHNVAHGTPRDFVFTTNPLEIDCRQVLASEERPTYRSHDALAWRVTKSLDELAPDDLHLVWAIVQRLRAGKAHGPEGGGARWVMRRSSSETSGGKPGSK